MTTQKRKHLSEFAEPGMGGPEQGVPAAPAHGQEVIGAHEGGIDREGAMAKADLYKLASYSHKLYEKIGEEDQLEAWVQAKITKAADYIASVYHYLEYEMKFSEYGHHLDNSDTLSESQKRALKGKLMEARAKMRDLKVAQAEKIAESEMGAEGAPCSACGGTGVEGGAEGASAGPRDVRAMAHPTTLAKADAYATKTRAAYAAHKRHEEEEEEGYEEEEEGMMEAAEKTSKPWTDKSGKTHPGTAVKGDKYTGKEAEKEKKVSEATKTEKPWTDKSGKTHTGTAVKGDKYTGKEAEKEKKVDEATKTPKSWTDKSGKTHTGTAVKGDKYTGKEAEKEKKVDESKPSAGLSKAKKSAVVKKAEAGKDIGKPGKNFKKVAAKAAEKYGSKEKGEKVAAAAMWKNVKETTAYVMEKEAATGKDAKFAALAEPKDKVTFADKIAGAKKNEKKKASMNESVETTRMREQLGRLNRAESHQIVESSEADQIRALTKRLLG